MKKGLLVNIYMCDFIDALSPIRTAKKAVIIDALIPEIFEPSEDAPQLKVVRRHLFGSDYIHVEPIEKGMYAFGGRFVYTSDSRFGVLSKYPIPLHDRNMNLEQVF